MEPSNTNLNKHQLTDESKAKIFASWLSLFVGLFLMALKFWAHELTGSQAILSDALESIVNVVAAGMAVFVVNYSSKPADRDHPYGHGKVEYFSSAFEGGLISFAGVFIVVEAFQAFWLNKPLSELSDGIILIFVTGIVNALLGYYLIRVGRKTKSVALKASGQHILSDVWTTLGIIVGLVLVQYFQILWLDSLIAVVVALFLLKTGWGLVKESTGGLLDAEDEELLERVQKAFNKNRGQGIIQVHHVKIIRSGAYHHIDAHMVLAEFWDVKQIHEKVKRFEIQFLKDYGWKGEMNFHLDPCRRVYCKNCNLQDCPIRKASFEKIPEVSLEELRSPDEPENFR